MPLGGGQQIASAYVTVGADLSGLRAAEAEVNAFVSRVGQLRSGGGTTGFVEVPHGIGGTILGGSFGGSPNFSSGMSTPAFGAPPAGPVLGSGMLTPSFGAPPPNPAQIQASGISPSFGPFAAASGIPTFSPPLQPTASGFSMGTLGLTMPHDSVDAFAMPVAPGRVAESGGLSFFNSLSATAMNEAVQQQAMMSGHLTGRVPVIPRPRHLLQQFPWAGGEYPAVSSMGLSPGGFFTRPGPTSSQDFLESMYENAAVGWDPLGIARGIEATPFQFRMPFDPTIREIEGMLGPEHMMMARDMAARVARGGGGRGFSGFGKYGVLSRLTGIPYAGVFAGLYAGSLVTSLRRIGVERDENQYLSQMYRPDEPFDITEDPMMRQFTEGLSEVEASEARHRLVPGIFAWMDVNLKNRADAIKGYRKAILAREFLLKSGPVAELETARLTGGDYAASMLESNRTINEAVNAASLLGDLGAAVPITDAEMMRQRRLGGMRIAEIQSIGAETQGAELQGIAARHRGLASQANALGGNGPTLFSLDQQRQAMELSQRAELLQLQSERSTAVAAAPLVDKDRVRGLYDSRITSLQEQQGAALEGLNTQMIIRAREVHVEREGFEAQGAAAREVMALRPISAEAVTDVARARREVQAASPENAESAIRNMQEVLRARQFELTAQRGGERAIDMPMSLAMGNIGLRGVDLTGRMLDVQNAQGIFGRGINDLSSARENPVEILSEIKSAVDQVLSTLQNAAQSLQNMN